MRTRIFLILAAMLSSLAAGAQDSAHFSERVERCLNALDFAMAKDAVRDWENADPDSPDLLCAKADLYFTESFEHEKDVPGGIPEGCASFVDAAGNGHYVYCGIVYDAAGIDSALRCLADGIGVFPDRLDMRFSMIQLLFVAGRNRAVADAASAVLDRSRLNGFGWYGRLGVPVGDARICVINALNGYVTMLKDTGAGEEAASIRRKLESYHQATGGQR